MEVSVLQNEDFWSPGAPEHFGVHPRRGEKPEWAVLVGTSRQLPKTRFRRETKNNELWRFPFFKTETFGAPALQSTLGYTPGLAEVGGDLGSQPQALNPKRVQVWVGSAASLRRGWCGCAATLRVLPKSWHADVQPEKITLITNTNKA